MLIGEGGQPDRAWSGRVEPGLITRFRSDLQSPYSAGGRSPQQKPAIDTKEDTSGMANAENGLVSPELVGGQPAPGRTRSGKPAGPAFKPMQRDDVDAMQMAELMELYDDSFRNMAEGEVVKG